MKMPPKIAAFVLRVTIADNPGSVSDPTNMTEDDRRAWAQLWPAWRLELLALTQALKRDGVRMTAAEQARVSDRIRRLDRLTYAGQRARNPLDASEALFAEAVWEETRPSRPLETRTATGDSTTRAASVRRSTGS
jgi:hypothetical protein